MYYCKLHKNAMKNLSTLLKMLDFQQLGKNQMFVV